MLGNNFLELKLEKMAVEEVPDHGSVARLHVVDGAGQAHECEGKGVGAVDAMYAAVVGRYAREYQSLTTLRLVSFSVAADVNTKKAQAGIDAVGKVTIVVANSENKHFTFEDASRSVTGSTAKVVLAMVQYFVNAERAFVTLHNARKDAAQRGREDLVARYTAELAEIVESTSYVDVLKRG